MSDRGLFELVAIAQYHQIPADPNQLRQQFGQPGLPFGSVEIIRAARSIGMKAKLVRYSKEKLNRNILPAIALSTKEDFIILAAAKDVIDQRQSLAAEQEHNEQLASAVRTIESEIRSLDAEARREALAEIQEAGR